MRNIKKKSPSCLLAQGIQASKRILHSKQRATRAATFWIKRFHPSFLGQLSCAILAYHGQQIASSGPQISPFHQKVVRKTPRQLFQGLIITHLSPNLHLLGLMKPAAPVASYDPTPIWLSVYAIVFSQPTTNSQTNPALPALKIHHSALMS